MLNETITYNDFVVGLAKNKLTFEVKEKKAFGILFFDSFFVWFSRLLIALIIIPLFFIPLISYKINNWWLLLGFLGFIIGNVVHGVSNMSSNPMKNCITLTLSGSLLLILLIYYIGILNPFIFTFACYIYTFFFLDFSNNLYDEVAMRKLIKDEKMFYYACENNIVEIKQK